MTLSLASIREKKVSVSSRVAVVGTLIVLVASLVGCAQQPKEGTQMNLAEAKAATIATENAIVAVIPKESISDHQQLTESSTLFTCPGGYNWPGRSTVEFVDGADSDAAVSAIKSHWSDKSGWTVTEDKTEAGGRRLDLKNADGSEFLVSQQKGGTELRISSYSVCFDLPGGVKGNETY